MSDPIVARSPRPLALAALILAPLQPLAGALSLLGLGRSIGAMSAASTTAATPASYAFVIWTPIFLLSVVWAIRQALPSMAEDPTAMRLRVPLVIAFALNILWMVVAQFSANGFHLVLILSGCVAAALWAFLPEARRLPEGAFARWVQRPFLGLFAGWVTAAVFANLAGALKATAFDPDPWVSAIIVLAAGGLAAGVLRAGRGDPWYLLAAGWGLLAILLGNAGLATVGLPGPGGVVATIRIEIIPAMAAATALVGVVAVGFGIWRKGGMTA